MKRLLCLLLLAATGCHKADPAPDAPLLGYWQATETHLYRYNGAGNVISDSVITASFGLRIERDSIKHYFNGNYVQVYAYKRDGEAINISQVTTGSAWYVRSFTPTSFTKEETIRYKSFTRQTTAYHR